MRRVPWLRLVVRFFAILWVVVAGWVGYLGRRVVSGRLDPAQRESLRGRCLALTLDRLGATFVKFGQILSTRPDLLGPGYVEALGRLQDRVAPIPFRDIERVLEAELAPSARSRLVSIDPEPMAAASVAQVHRAWLDGGRAVVLKVQRPAARAQIERDLVLLAAGARLLELVPSVRLLSLRGSVERFGDAMHRQLDFEEEARNNRRFADHFAHVSHVGVPALYPELCTARLLTMECIEGVRATEPEKVGADRRAIARRGLETILQMVFDDGFVHADLHPGNILLSQNGRVTLIDLGLVAEIPDDMKRPWIETFVALSTQDGPRAARLLYGYAPTVGTRDYVALERDVVAHMATFHGKPLSEMEVSQVLAGMMNVLRRHRVQIDPVFTVVNVALLVAEGLGKQLDPDLDLVDLATPHIARALASAPPGRAPLREPPSDGPGDRAIGPGRSTDDVELDGEVVEGAAAKDEQVPHGVVVR
jgi:ubiquinone biosynthesis protein